MFDFSGAKIKHIALHKVGNKVQEEPLQLSDFELDVEKGTSLYKSMMEFFLKPFKESPIYHFTAESGDFHENVMFGYSEKIFENPFEQFLYQSREVATYLYETSTHPAIKGGDLYVVYLEDCVVNRQVVDVIGLFKTEHKERFLKTSSVKDGLVSIVEDEGVSVRKLDKGCLVIHNEENKGFQVVLKDSPSKSVEALYWKESFLRLTPRQDSFFHTKNYLDLCKGFVEDVFNEGHNVEKPAQIDMLNRSLRYFAEKDEFNTVEFENDVIGQEPEVIEAFTDYKKTYADKHEVPMFDEFVISRPAVRKSKKDFKGVITLDRKIQITVNGNEQNVEKGFDNDKQMNYYIVYYHEEA